MAFLSDEPMQSARVSWTTLAGVARRGIWLLALAGALWACSQRPDQAFTPQNFDIDPGGGSQESPLLDAGKPNVDASIPHFPGSGAGGGSAGQADGGGADGGQGGAAGGAQDAGAGGGTGGADAAPSPELARLQELAGYYYMRMDMLSQSTVRTALAAVTTRNRISHLLVTRLGVDQGRLFSVEQLCHQNYAHTCDSGCDSLATTLYPDVLTELVSVQPTRNYQVNMAGGGLQLVGEAMTMYLGFDASSDKSLPSSNADARVWLDGMASGTRKGLWLNLNVKARVGLLSSTINCDVYTVQSFNSKFEGTLKGTLQQPSLLEMSASLDITGTDGKTVGTTSNDCKDDPSNPPSSTAGVQTVRFARANVTTPAEESAFWSCPDVSAWDGPLPAPSP